MTGCPNVTQRLVAGSKRSPVPSGSPIGVDRAAAARQHHHNADLGVVDRRVVAQRHSTSVGGSPGLTVPDGMPLSATEILAFAGTGSYFSVVGIGADDGLTSQLLAWPAAGVLELVAAGLLAAVVIGPGVARRACGDRDRCRDGRRCDQSVFHKLLVAWSFGHVCFLFLVKSGRGYASSAAISVRGTETFPGPSCRKS